MRCVVGDAGGCADKAPERDFVSSISCISITLKRLYTTNTHSFITCISFANRAFRCIVIVGLDWQLGICIFSQPSMSLWATEIELPPRLTDTYLIDCFYRTLKDWLNLRVWTQTKSSPSGAFLSTDRIFMRMYGWRDEGDECHELFISCPLQKFCLRAFHFFHNNFRSHNLVV